MIYIIPTLTIALCINTLFVVVMLTEIPNAVWANIFLKIVPVMLSCFLMGALGYLMVSKGLLG